MSLNDSSFLVPRTHTFIHTCDWDHCGFNHLNDFSHEWVSSQLDRIDIESMAILRPMRPLETVFKMRSHFPEKWTIVEKIVWIFFLFFCWKNNNNIETFYSVFLTIFILFFVIRQMNMGSYSIHSSNRFSSFATCFTIG